MNLIIDIGNTFVKIAVFEKDRLLAVEKISENFFLNNISTFFETYPFIKQIMISSVGKLSNIQLDKLSTFAPVSVLDAKTKIPFKNGYTTPNTLGMDRIALMAAAFHKYKGQNSLVIDAGSCITYDFIDKKGVYLGGAIAPGLHMRFKAMNAFTANLPLIDSFEFSDFIGTSTQTCMISGVINGSINEIETTILQYKERFKDLTVILTGGDSHFLSKRLKSSIFAHPYFSLEGINYILEFNKR